MQITFRDVLIVIALLGIFFSTNFETNLGNIFSIVLLVGTVAYLIDKKHEIEIEKVSNKGKSVLFAVGAYIVFIFSSSIIMPFIGSIIKMFSSKFTYSLNAFSTNSIINTFSQSNLALTGNSFFQFLALSFFIAPTETIFFFGTLYEYGLDKLKTNLGFNIKNIALILILASIFTFVHLTAKGVSNNEALMLVFYFAVISLVLAIITKQLLEPILLHVIANGVASLPLLGINVSGFTILVYAGLIGLGLFLITRFFDFKTFKIVGGG